MSSLNDNSHNDPLWDEVDALRRKDPAPALGGAAKAAIVEAAVAAYGRPVTLWGQLRYQLATLFRPAALGTLAFAGIAGVLAGALLPAAADQYMSPEDELIAYYEQSIWDDGSDDDLIAEESM